MDFTKIKYNKGQVILEYQEEKGENDIMGATITSLISLKHTSAPMVVNTPHKPSEPYSGEDYSNCLAGSCINRLERLKNEAEKYLEGERAQQNLDM